ncbi:MAG TPA: hypothetical protein VHN59_01160 [Chitinophagaceae bacterium]|nr:hypothetical protein [Chitinophagaceae bacterium]
MADFLDISTSTPNVTSTKRGDYNMALSTVIQVNKEQGASTAIRRGYALGRSDLVTPNVFAKTTAKEDGTVVISALPFPPYMPSYVNVTDAADGTGEDISASDDDYVVQGIIKGRVAVKMSGTGQPGQQVMTADEGEFAAYDGSGAQYVKGVFLGLPGASLDGAVIKQGWTDGVLGVIDFNGGA